LKPAYAGFLFLGWMNVVVESVRRFGIFIKWAKNDITDFSLFLCWLWFRVV